MLFIILWFETGSKLVTKMLVFILVIRFDEVGNWDSECLLIVFIRFYYYIFIFKWEIYWF